MAYPYEKHKPNVDVGDPELYYYDPTEPNEICAFIERYLVHTDAQHASKPFHLIPWQIDDIHNVYGVKRRSDRLNRYSKWWLEGPKSLGKSPLMAALCIYTLFKSKSANPFVASAASEYTQARIVYEKAAKMIRASKALGSKVNDGTLAILEREMRYAFNGGKWSVITGDSWSGGDPILVTIDEVHELKASDGNKLSVMEGNLKKRHNSLMILATNTGWDKTSVAGRYHDKCERIKAGTVRDDSIYVSIFSAPAAPDGIEEKDWIAKPATWLQANPSIGYTISLDDYQRTYDGASKLPDELLRFRRLWLSQWVSASETWLKLDDIANAIVDELPANVSTLPCYVGFDMGGTDDLTSCVWLWVDEQTNEIWIKAEQWITSVTAFGYAHSHGIDYVKWKEAGDIYFVPGRVTTIPQQHDIAAHIVKQCEGLNVVRACVDRAKNDVIIHDLTEAGLTVVAIPSNTSSLNEAVRDFETRLLDGSLHILKNECYLWQLSEVSLYTDAGGLSKPEKPGASRNYAGKRQKKMDSVMATMYSLAHGRIHLMKGEDDKPADISDWDGTISFV